MLKGPSLHSVLDVRQAHVLVTSRHSFKIEIQTVPTNLTISFSWWAAESMCSACIYTCARARLWRIKNRWTGRRHTCGWCSAWFSWSHRCHSCDCILRKDPTRPSNPHRAPGHKAAVWTLHHNVENTTLTHVRNAKSHSVSRFFLRLRSSNFSKGQEQTWKLSFFKGNVDEKSSKWSEKIIIIWAFPWHLEITAPVQLPTY